MESRERLLELLTADLDGIETEAEYARAAHFVAFLSERYGWEAILGLDAARGPESGVAALDAAFEAVLGAGLDAVLAQYEGYPECTGTVDMSIACAEPPTASVDFSNTSHERLVDCASASGVGPHLGMVFVEEVIELGAAINGSRIVAGHGEGMDKGGFVVIRRCGPCSENGVAKIVDGLNGFVSEQDFPPGRYVVRFYLPVDAGPAVVGFDITG